MKNYFYSNQLAERIKTLLDANLPPDTANNIYVGDLSVLPAPERLDGYLPTVVISADEIENTFANEARSLLYSPYAFTVYYIYPYTFEGDNDAVREGKHGAEAVANVLMNYRTLGGFTVPKSETEAGGLVVHSSLTSIKFDGAEQELFRALEVPAQFASIEFVAGFRTYNA